MDWRSSGKSDLYKNKSPKYVPRKVSIRASILPKQQTRVIRVLFDDLVKIQSNYAFRIFKFSPTKNPIEIDFNRVFYDLNLRKLPVIIKLFLTLLPLSRLLSI